LVLGTSVAQTCRSPDPRHSRHLGVSKENPSALDREVAGRGHRRVVGDVRVGQPDVRGQVDDAAELGVGPQVEVVAGDQRRAVVAAPVAVADAEVELAPPVEVDLDGRVEVDGLMHARERRGDHVHRGPRDPCPFVAHRIEVDDRPQRERGRPQRPGHQAHGEHGEPVGPGGVQGAVVGHGGREIDVGVEQVATVVAPLVRVQGQSQRDRDREELLAGEAAACELEDVVFEVDLAVGELDPHRGLVAEMSSAVPDVQLPKQSSYAALASSAKVGLIRKASSSGNETLDLRLGGVDGDRGPDPDLVARVERVVGGRRERHRHRVGDVDGSAVEADELERHRGAPRDRDLRLRAASRADAAEPVDAQALAEHPSPRRRITEVLVEEAVADIPSTAPPHRSPVSENVTCRSTVLVSTSVGSESAVFGTSPTAAPPSVASPSLATPVVPAATAPTVIAVVRSHAVVVRRRRELDVARVVERVRVVWCMSGGLLVGPPATVINWHAYANR
jgi:hypothetical protein